MSSIEPEHQIRIRYRQWRQFSWISLRFCEPIAGVAGVLFWSNYPCRSVLTLITLFFCQLFLSSLGFSFLFLDFFFLSFLGFFSFFLLPHRFVLIYRTFTISFRIFFPHRKCWPTTRAATWAAAAAAAAAAATTAQKPRWSAFICAMFCLIFSILF